jgi:hypothetical protein
MELKIIRTKSNKEYTEGKLYINGVYFCDTLEDKDRGLLQTMTVDTIKTIKVYKETCIPYGKYKAILSMSKRFGKVMPELLDVKGFVGVRIHSGNTIYDTEGCILVGVKSSNGTITNSRKTFNALMSILKTQKSISLIIE